MWGGMAGSLFGRLSLEEGDSANSLEGLDIKLGGEGKSEGSNLLLDSCWIGSRTESWSWESSLFACLYF